MNKWHIIAYCQLRRDYRDFRIDRIDALTSTTDCFTKSHPTLKKYLSKIVRKENLTQVILRMKKKMQGTSETKNIITAMFRKKLKETNLK